MRFLIFLFLSIEALAGTHALLIGIANYPEASLQLNGPLNDVALMKKILETKYPGIKTYVLLDEAATREGILAAFRDLEHLERDDRLIIYYSGHGSRSEDYNSDETSGYDSTWIAYGSRTGDGPNSYDVLDDEIDAHLNRLKTRNIIFISDSCHSGSVGHSSLERSIEMDHRVHPMAHQRFESKREGILYLGAVRDDQRAIELTIGQNVYGVFTHSLAQALMEADNDTQWRDLLLRIRGLMRQHRSANRLEPQISGNTSQSLNFLKGTDPNTQSVVLQERKGRWLMDVGRVSGFAEGTLFQSTDTCLRLVQCELFMSWAEVIEGPAPQPGDLFFLKKFFLSKGPLKVSQRLLIAEDDTNLNIKNWLGYEFENQLEWVDDYRSADWVLTYTKTRHGRLNHQELPPVSLSASPIFWLTDANHKPIIQRPLARHKRALKKGLNRLLRRQALLDLENPYQKDDFEFKARFFDARPGPGRKATSVQGNTYYQLAHHEDIKQNQVFVPTLKNKNTTVRYLYCLYFEPDGRVRCIFPTKEMPDQAARFESETYRAIVEAAMKLDIKGTERFRVISSKRPIQRSLLETGPAAMDHHRNTSHMPKQVFDWSTKLFTFQVQ